MTSNSTSPRLTLGLPVYNGERYLAESLDALLGQSYTDFELIIADNCSTDGTEAVAKAYVSRDSRVRYIRHPRNMGSAFNHNFVIAQAGGEYFKWVSDDDLYAPDLLERCMEALQQRPDAVLAHAWTAYLDDAGEMTHRPDYPLVTDVADPVVRFRSLLYTQGGDDIYGIIRMPVLRQVLPHGSYHLADRVFVAELALRGPFVNVPEFLYYRRDHPARTSRVGADIRRRCVRLDPVRASRLRHPTIRLLAEYVFGYLRVIYRAPITARQRLACYRELTLWILKHVDPSRRLKLKESPDPAFRTFGDDTAGARASSWLRSVLGRTVPGSVREDTKS